MPICMLDLKTIQGLNLPKKRFMATNASFWKRSIAFIIDILIMDLFFFTPFKKFLLLPELEKMGFRELIQQSTAQLPNTFIASIIFMGIIALLYFSLQEYYLGHTIGKQIMGLRVIGRKGFGYYLLRHAYIIPIFPFTIFWFVEPFMLIRKKQRFLEQISKTVTIELTALN